MTARKWKAPKGLTITSTAPGKHPRWGSDLTDITELTFSDGTSLHGCNHCRRTFATAGSAFAHLSSCPEKAAAKKAAKQASLVKPPRKKPGPKPKQPAQPEPVAPPVEEAPPVQEAPPAIAVDSRSTDDLVSAAENQLDMLNIARGGVESAARDLARALRETEASLAEQTARAEKAEAELADLRASVSALVKE